MSKAVLRSGGQITGGEHPPNSADLGKTSCEVRRCRHWERRQGAEVAVVSSRTSVPLSPSKIHFPQLLGAEQAAHFSQFLFFWNPAFSRLHPQPNGWATNPPIHKWRIPSSKGAHAHTPGSTNRHTCSALMPPPPPPRSAPQAALHRTGTVPCVDIAPFAFGSGALSDSDLSCTHPCLFAKRPPAEPPPL